MTSSVIMVSHPSHTPAKKTQMIGILVPWKVLDTESYSRDPDAINWPWQAGSDRKGRMRP